MNIIKSEQVTFWDIDDTLILSSYDIIGRELAAIQDPLNEHRVLYVPIHHPMVRLLKEEHARGATIIVWSKGGYQWAANVIKALGLEDYVHEVMSKPAAYFDDKPIAEWLPYRVWLDPDKPYRSNSVPKPTNKES